MTLYKTSILFLLLGEALGMSAQLTIGGVPVVTDSTAELMLCTLPEATFWGHCQAVVAYNDALCKGLSIDGTFVANGSQYDFGDVSGGATFSIVAHTHDGDKHYTLQFTFLPIVQLDGDFGYDYTTGTVSVTMPGQSDSAVFAAKAKWRGGTTNAPDRHKRNYHVKLLDAKGQSLDYGFFGLRSDNDWLLDAGQIDLARIRNHVGMELWNDFASKPYYSAHEPSALNGVRSQVVEVFLNGTYNGIYSMGEAMDRKQLKLKKTKADANEIRGQLWKTTNWSSAVMMYEAPFMPFRNAETWFGYETKYPDPDDTKTDYSTLREALRFVSEADAATFTAEVGERFDLPVLIDYYILMNVLNSVDNTAKNIYWAVYDRTRSTKLTLAPWDLDATVGQYWNNTPEDGQVTRLRNPDFKLGNYAYVYLRLLKHNAQDFGTRLKQRYTELRQGVLNTDSLVNRYVGAIEMLQRAGAASREETRWSGDSDICYLPLDFEQQKEYITQWLRARMPFIDYYVFGLPPIDINGDGALDVFDLSLLVDMVLGKVSPVPQADLDGNGMVDVADVNRLIDLVLEK